MNELTQDQRIHTLALQFAKACLEEIPSDIHGGRFEQGAIKFLENYLASLHVFNTKYDSVKAEVTQLLDKSQYR